MKSEEYGLMYQVETSHWWYRGMQSLTRALLPTPGTLNNQEVLDAGCGTGGAMSGFLSDYGKVTGCDLSPLALAYCQKRELTRIAQASVTQLPFASGLFGLVTSFDVLYEQGVASDKQAISEFWRVLKPGGYLFLRLPAYDWLRGRHDERIQTARRYNKSQVKTMLTQSQFEIVRLTYANSFLLPLALAKRIFDHILPSSKEESDLQTTPVWVNPILEKILTSEANLISRLDLPFGLSVLALAQKRQ